MKKVVFFFVLILILGLGVFVAYPTYKLNTETKLVLTEYSKPGKAVFVKHEGFYSKYTAKGLEITIANPEYSIDILHFISDKKTKEYTYRLLGGAQESGKVGILIKNSGDLKIIKGYFSDELEFILPNHLKVGSIVDDKLIFPPIEQKSGSEKLSVKIDIMKLMPWEKNVPVWKYIEKINYKGKDISGYVNGKKWTQADSLKFEIDYDFDSIDNVDVDGKYEVKNYINYINNADLEEMLSSMIVPNRNSNQYFSNAQIMTLLNIPQDTEPTTVSKGKLKFSFDLKCDEKGSDKCVVKFKVKDLDWNTNVGDLSCDDFAFEIKETYSPINSSGNNSEPEDHKHTGPMGLLSSKNTEERSFDIEADNMKLSLTKVGYHNLIAEVKRVSSIPLLMSRDITPVNGYLGIYPVKAMNRSAWLPASQLLFVAYFEKLFIPYDWINGFSFNMAHKLKDTNAAKGIEKNEFKYVLDKNDLNGKAFNTFYVDFKDNPNKGGAKGTIKVAFSDPNESINSVVDYFNNISETVMYSGSSPMNIYPKMKSSMATLLVQAITDLSDEVSGKRVIEVNISSKKDMMPSIDIKGKPAQQQLGQYSSQIESQVEMVPGKRSAEDFIKSLADDGLLLANYFYGCLALEKGDLDSAIKYSSVAEEASFAPALPVLGISYFKKNLSNPGAGMKKALHYFKLGSNNGDLFSSLNTGVVYSLGLGKVAKSNDEATYYYNLAMQGDSEGSIGVKDIAEFNIQSMLDKQNVYLIALNQEHVDIYANPKTKQDIDREFYAYTRFLSYFLKGNSYISIPVSKYPEDLVEYAKQIFSQSQYFRLV